jgi:hypothetical protein
MVRAATIVKTRKCDRGLMGERSVTKAILGLITAILLAILAARITYNLNTDYGEAPANIAWAQSEMQFVAWNNEKWTAWIHDGAFELAPQNTDMWSRHSNVSLAFTDWHGESWQAKIEGESFLLAFRGDWQGSVKQADAIRFRDWSGNNQLRTVAELQR